MTAKYHIQCNHDDSRSRDADRQQVNSLVNRLLASVGGANGGTWVNIEVSNIDQGSGVESYSLLLRGPRGESSDG